MGDFPPKGDRRGTLVAEDKLAVMQKERRAFMDLFDNLTKDFASLVGRAEIQTNSRAALRGILDSLFDRDGGIREGGVETSWFFSLKKETQQIIRDLFESFTPILDIIQKAETVDDFYKEIERYCIQARQAREKTADIFLRNQSKIAYPYSYVAEEHFHDMQPEEFFRIISFFVFKNFCFSTDRVEGFINTYQQQHPDVEHDADFAVVAEITRKIAEIFERLEEDVGMVFDGEDGDYDDRN